MRRISRWVTGVPLPGWIFSAVMTRKSLPSFSRTLPLRTELAITETTKPPQIHVFAGGYSRGAIRGQNALVDGPKPCRPAAPAAPAGAVEDRYPRPFRGSRLHRGGVRGAGRIPRERDPFACFRDPPDWA